MKTAEYNSPNTSDAANADSAIRAEVQHGGCAGGVCTIMFKPVRPSQRQQTIERQRGTSERVVA
jgi:hypothetical protein